MKISTLKKLNNIAISLEKSGMHREADAVSETVIRISALFTPTQPISDHDMVYPYDKATEKEYEEQDKKRMEFQRYRTPEYHGLHDDADDHGSTEEKLHGPSPVTGPAVITPDFSSSVMQGGNWGKLLDDDRDKNEAAGEAYKNLMPNNY